MLLTIRQVRAVDQPLQRVLAVLLRPAGAEYHLVALRQEIRFSAAVRAELDSQGVRVFRKGLLPDLKVGEVAVLQQVDRVEQLAGGVQAQRRDDLPGRQPEQPDTRAGDGGGMLPAREL